MDDTVASRYYRPHSDRTTEQEPTVTTTTRTAADLAKLAARIDTVANRAERGHGHKAGAERVVQLLLTRGLDRPARQVRQAITGTTDVALLRHVASTLPGLAEDAGDDQEELHQAGQCDTATCPATSHRRQLPETHAGAGCGPREDGATLADGRPRCRCGQPANPAGYCCETGAVVQLGERRRVTDVGLDGASQRMYRYADELHLPDYARSIVPVHEWPEGAALARAVHDERMDRKRAEDDGREPGHTASGRRRCPSCYVVERMPEGLVHSAGCVRVVAGLVR